MVARDTIRHEDGSIETVYCEDCPRKLAPAIAYWLADHYHAYKHGTLLVAGGLLDQPNFYLDGMRAMHGAVSEVEADEHKKLAEKWKHKGQR